MYINQTNQPKPLKDLMKQDFNPAEMGPGYRRGMVLRVYKGLIKKLTGRKEFAGDITGEKITGEHITDSKDPKYRNPTLIIYVRPGSIWKHELHQLRYQIRKAINERLKCEFIKEVRIK